MTRILATFFMLTLSTAIGGATELDWSLLKLPTNDREAFDESIIPEAVREQLGHPVTLRGYMMVSSVTSTTGIRRFGMWAETTEKPVNVNAWQTLPLHHLVVVEMVGDATTEFIINSPIEVLGELTIDVLRHQDGTVASVYKIRARRVLKSAKREGHFPAASPGC